MGSKLTPVLLIMMAWGVMLTNAGALITRLQYKDIPIMSSSPVLTSTLGGLYSPYPTFDLESGPSYPHPDSNVYYDRDMTCVKLQF